MNDPQDSINLSIEQFVRLKKYFSKIDSKQVRNVQDKLLVKATIYTWFNNNLPCIENTYGKNFLLIINEKSKKLLELTEINASKDSYLRLLKDIKNEIVNLRSKTIDIKTHIIKNDKPNFSVLIPDQFMQKIVDRRWEECEICLNAGAALASIIMMGGLIESLFLARINQMKDKSMIFKSSKIPKNREGENIELKDWRLKDYIDVFHDLKWISKAGKEISEVLRDYRNYVHPEKERRHNVQINIEDAKLLWGVCKLISNQIIDSMN